MHASHSHSVPFILAGILLFNLVGAAMNGGRVAWLVVAVLALALALMLWQRARAQYTDHPPL